MASARRFLESAERVVVLTGAGVSADSGVPTFRGPQGLWRNHSPEQLATPEAFARDPRLVWEWYDWRRCAVEACRPNVAHFALARLALSRPGVRIVTQNVDGLHADAAASVSDDRDPSPAMPLELHGSIFRIRCTGCGRPRDHRERIDSSSVTSLPHCGQCGAPLRPDVVWFGETLDPAVLNEALHLGHTANVCLVVGTSAVVYPAIGIALATAESGGAVIEVNPDETPLTAVAAVSLRGPACDVVPELVDGYSPSSSSSSSFR